MSPIGLHRDEPVDMRPLVVIALVVIVYFWNIIFMREMYFMGDLADLYYPMFDHMSRSLKSFHMPLWMDGLGQGYPMYAERQVGVFYPLNLIMFFALPVRLAFNLQFPLHFFLGGAFTYVFLHYLKLSRFASLGGSLIFTFSGFMMAHITHPNFIQACIWLPWNLLAVERTFTTRNPRWLFGITFGLVMQILAGHPQVVFYSMIFTGAYAFILWISTSGFIFPKRGAIFSFTVFTCCIVIFPLLLSAVQILPTMELAGMSTRGTGQSSTFLGNMSLSPLNLVTFIFPDILGRSNAEEIGNYAGPGSYIETCGYIGILPFLFVIVGILAARHRRFNFFLIALVISVVLAMGKYTPVHYLMKMLPGFNLFRAPARWLFITDFCLAVLAAYGLDSVSDLYQRVKRHHIVRLTGWTKMFLAVLLVLILLINILLLISPDIFSRSMSWYITKGLPGIDLESHSQEYYLAKTGRLSDTLTSSLRIYDAAAYVPLILIFISVLLLHSWRKSNLFYNPLATFTILLIIVDLFVFSWTLNPKVPPGSVLSPPAAAGLIEKKREGRLTVYPKFSSQVDPQLMQTGLAPVFGLKGTDNKCPLSLKVREEIWSQVKPEVPDADGLETMFPYIPEYRPVLDMLDVRYVISRDKIEDENLELLQSRPVFIYHNPLASGRFYFPTRLIKVDYENIWDSLTLYMEMLPYQAALVPSDTEVRTEVNMDGPVARLVVEEDNYLELEVQCSSPAFIVLADQYYPGWKAYCDDKEVPVIRTNGFLRGVDIPSGTGKLTLTYSPFRYYLGAIISFFSLIVCGWLIVGIRSRRRPI